MAALSRAESRGAGRLTVRTVAVPDPGDLLAQVPQPDMVAWVQHGAGLVGWGEAARITLPAGEDRFTAAEKWLGSVFDAAVVDDKVRLRGSGPVAFGAFTFDASSDGSVLIVPQALLGRDGQGHAWLTVTLGGDDPPQTPPAHGGAIRPPVPPRQVLWHDGSLPAPQWGRAVAEAVAAIKAGSLRKVVLARDLYATAAGDIDPRIPLRRLADRYPECFTFACDGLIGATPELLIRRDGGQVSALVLAGTAPRGGDTAADEALGQWLLASAKDNEEHVYAVESIREALGPLCDALDIEPRPALIKLPNLQHLGTWVHGTLAAAGPPRSALALAAAVHPTAAVCGTPTGAAFELIRELEHMDRERYAGAAGWVDADGNGEWGIALRCAQLSGRTARLFAGGGIVAGSEPAAELAELEVKFRPMRGALEG
ncbi:MAG: isochorismate synthase [Streptosporangiaceae bacterium]